MSTEQPTNTARLDSAIARACDAAAILKGAVEEIKIAYHDLMRKDAQRDLLALHGGDPIKAAEEIDPILAKLDEAESAAGTAVKAGKAVKQLAARANAGITDHYEETLTEADRKRDEIARERKAGGGPLFGTEEPQPEGEKPAPAKGRGRKRKAQESS